MKMVKLVLLAAEVEAQVRASSGPYSKGHLARTIRAVGPHPVFGGVSGRVEAGASYARIVERGAKIHQIFPKGAPHVYRFGSHRRPQLKFFWRRAGKVVFMPHVPGSRARVGLSHPGLRGKHYLTEALRAASRRNNFRVIIFPL
jgi:hypothetical protein